MKETDQFDKEPGGVFRLGENCELKTYADVSPADVNSYFERLNTLPELTLYAEHTIGKNQYRTYRREQGGILHVAYTAADCSLRITEDQLNGRFQTLPPVESEPYHKICEPNAAVMALDYTVQNIMDSSGFSFVFRLEDGSFVIFDGGYLEDAPRLYSYLLDKTKLPGNEIVISAWIFTHSHSDHYRCFVGFSRMFAERVKVKYFVFNSPPPDPSIIYLPHYDSFLTEEFFEYAKRYEGAKTVRVHSGQTFALPGATLEVLQTYEDILPQASKWLNEVSIVTRMHIRGQTFLFMGDEELKADERLILLGDALKSDFAQVTHHGWSGGTPETFRLIDPKYLIWSTSYECYNYRTMRSWRNGMYCTLVHDMNVKRSFISDIVCKVIPIPFEPFESVGSYYPRGQYDVELYYLRSVSDVEKEKEMLNRSED